ncbi:MAG: DUF4843 domain-containing protein [Odoribacteraceae bacterium]|jgi:hypothetical protein|nr:DUF4843 domain-containing protein [Odoribacteraceae bacterium]
MKINHITRLLLLPLLLAACQEVVVNKYEDNSSLYFYRGALDARGNGQFDSLAYSFYLEESGRVRDTLWIEARLSGFPSAVARPVPVVQLLTGSDDAVAGQHYLSFDDPEIKSLVVLPPNAVKVKLPIVLLREPSLKTTERQLLLEITTNEYFSVGIQGQRRFLIRFSDLATQPANWTATWKSVFGDWGAVKMRFIIDYVGFSDFDATRLLGDMRDYLKVKAKQKLADYEAANGPLYEDDNVTRVRFP